MRFQDHHQHEDHSVVEEIAGRLSRRDLLKRSLALGLSVPLISALLAACGEEEEPPAVATDDDPVATDEDPVDTDDDPVDEPAIGAHLIGELEGPEIVTDRAQFPTQFNEAPQLAELVQSGTLPPVEERIGQDPLVIRPVHEIGQYGGTWQRGFTGPGDRLNGVRAAAGPDGPLYWDYSVQEIVPNICKGWEVSADGRSTVLELRRGMKWSDGADFTADDFVFWFEDIYGHDDLVPGVRRELSINGEPGFLEKVDTYTIEYSFPDSYPMFVHLMASLRPGASIAANAQNYMGGVAPAHYLQQFHPDYVSEEELNELIQEEGFDDWTSLFEQRSDWALNPDLPVLSPWKTSSPSNSPRWVLERNPYSVWVDTDGNQLPYIDRVELTLAEDLEVLNLRAIAGEYDFQARHLDIAKLPVFLENQDQGDYDIYLDTGDYGSDMIITVNQNFDADPEIGMWLADVDFRRALSLGINRDQLNETFWLGTGTPGSPAPAETNMYSPGPEYRTLWATHDPDTANEMLDELGLTEKDNEGYRLRTDGGGRLRIEMTTWGGQFMPYTQISEMIRDHWKDIGIDLFVSEVERSLGQTRNAANEVQLWSWTNDGSESLFIFPHRVFPNSPENALGPLYGEWFHSGGEQGQEPPPIMREVMDKFNRAFGVSDEERIELGKEIWETSIDQVWGIGVVGLAAGTMGVRVAKRGMGNVPSRMFNSPAVFNPNISRPVTFFWK